jgi:hypothetical protein
VLTFKFKSQLIDFITAPGKTRLFLENQSHFEDFEFIVQVSDPSYFRVQPSFGKILREQTIELKVSFLPQPLKRRQKINGFLLVRLLNGMPLERYN